MSKGEAAVLTSYLLFAILFSLLIPIFEAPDEQGHFENGLFISENSILPVQNTVSQNFAHHPPLYYLLISFPLKFVDTSNKADVPELRPDFVWPDLNQPSGYIHSENELFPYSGIVLGVHLARGVSIISGLLTLLFAKSLFNKLFEENHFVALTSLIIVALNPQFIFINSTITNDSLLVTITTATLWCIQRLISQPTSRWWWFMLGTFIGMAIMTKSTAIIFLVPIFGLWFFLAFQSSSKMEHVKLGFNFFIPVFMLTSWWFIRNYNLYGDLLGWEYYVLAWSDALRTAPLNWAEGLLILSLQLRSFWGVFGWMNIYMPNGYYFFILLFYLHSAIFTFFAFFRKPNIHFSQHSKYLIWTLFAYVVSLECFIFYQNTIHNLTLAQGRFLMPVVTAISIWLTFGIFSAIAEKYYMTATIATYSFLFVSVVYSMFFEILPAYTSGF